MLLGHGAHPATGEPIRDVARARKLIDQLELLEANPEGLGAEEMRLVRESLHSVRLAFVEAVGETPAPAASPAPDSPPPAAAETKPLETPDSADEDRASRKRFIKKYD